MIEVRLHGDLARQFGKVWHFEIASPREAFRALAANNPGWRAAVGALTKAGMVFRVRSASRDYSSDDVDMRLGQSPRVDIIPIIGGSSAGTRFVVGAILMYAGYVVQTFGGPYAPIGTAMMAAGASLMVGSVVEWLTPAPKKNSAPGGLTSWTISGPTNTIEQGYPVPVIYGEVLAGGYTVSAGVSSEKFYNTISADRGAQIGGETTITAPFTYSGTPRTVTVVFKLSAAPIYLDEPYTYTWNAPSFPGSQAVRLKDGNKATATIEVDYLLTGIGQFVLNGNVTVVVVGRMPDRSYSGVSDNKSLTAYIIGKSA